MPAEPRSLKELFLAAVAIAPEERTAWLDRECGQNVELRRRVELMLAAHDTPQSLLDLLAPAAEPPEEATGAFKESETDRLPDAKHEEVGAMIAGRYKLLEPIGEGGMGTVWMAEQTEPIKRLVAVKVVKEGMDSKQVLARFEAERQALALMEHPNISKVLDAGKTPSGRPFFVMELVKGKPITIYCDEKRLSLRERLELFGDVCRAVQHAHQKGIIHRDLKPSNILVAPYDGEPVVKVIDFGIAKATGQRLTDKTLFTGFGVVVGTPEYMSPEQAEINNQDIDTRSDIYSLGVLLYELLTGTTPLTRKRIKEAALLEVLRVIREEEPPRPSTRLSESKDSLPSISAQRQSEPLKLTKLVRGELDWIAMKALEKDRNRRYETANGLVMDVQRYLADEPVQACPPSAWYRVHKFMRRHKGRVTAAVVMLVLLLAGTAVSIWQAVRATHAEQQKQTALEQVTAAQAQTREALDTLTDDVMETLFSRQSEFGEKEKEFLHKVLGFYEAFTQQSAEAAEARFFRAKGHHRAARLRSVFGEHGTAVTGYRQAEALLEQLAADFPDEVEYRHKLAITEGNLGIELGKQGKLADAEAAFRRAITLYSKLVEDSPKALVYRSELAGNYHNLAFLRDLQRNYAEAEESYRRSLDLREKLVAEAGDVPLYHRELSAGRIGLGELLRKQQKYAESEKIYRQIVKALEEQIDKGPATAKDRRWLADAYKGLGSALVGLRRLPEGEDALRSALEVRRKLAEDFPGMLDYRRALADITGDLGLVLWRQGKEAAAKEPCRQALELRKAIVKQAGPVPTYRRELAMSYHSLAWMQSVTGQPKEAESTWRAALKIWQQLAVDSPRDPEFQDAIAGMLTNLAQLHNQRREFDDAAALLDKARSHLQTALKAEPKRPNFRESYQEYLVALARSRLGLSDHVGLAATADELARFGYEPTKDSYHAAGLLGRCAMLADKDAKLDMAKRKELAQRYADQASGLLRQAVERGFKDAAQMKKDPNLEPLRTREEYKKLLADLERKTKP